MPIDLLSSIKKTSQWTFSSPTINYILGSSLFIAIIIALVMVLLIMIMYPARKNTQLSVLCKMFIYMFFSSLLIVFLHDGVIKTMYDEELQSSEENNMMSGIDVVNADAVYNSNPMSTLVQQQPVTQQPVMPISAPISSPPVQPVINERENNVQLAEFITGGGTLHGHKPPGKKSNLFKQDLSAMI